MPNAWVQHCRDYAEKHGCSYKDAMQKSKGTYKGTGEKKYEPKKKKEPVAEKKQLKEKIPIKKESLE